MNSFREQYEKEIDEMKKQIFRDIDEQRTKGLFTELPNEIKGLKEIIESDLKS